MTDSCPSTLSTASASPPTDTPQPSTQPANPFAHEFPTFKYQPVAAVDAGDAAQDRLRVLPFAVSEQRRLRLLTQHTIELWGHDLKLPSLDRPVYCTGPSKCPLCSHNPTAYTRLVPAFDEGRQVAGLLRATGKVVWNALGEPTVQTKPGSLLAQLDAITQAGGSATADVIIMIAKPDQYTFAVRRVAAEPSLEPSPVVLNALRQRLTATAADIAREHVLYLTREALLANPDVQRLIAASTAG
jgi:hypothetical protein